MTTASGAGATPQAGAETGANTATQAPAATPATPQAGATTSPTQPTTPPAEEPMSLEEARKLRKESNELRKRIKEVDDATAAAELAKLGDLDKATKQLEAATKQMDTYKATISRMAVELAASKHGFQDPADAAAFVAGKLDIGDDGMPTNVDELLKDLLKAKPYLLKPTEPAAGQQQQQQTRVAPTNPGRGTPQSQQPGQPRTLARFGTGQKLFEK